jgi:hypothetical protein
VKISYREQAIGHQSRDLPAQPPVRSEQLRREDLSRTINRDNHIVESEHRPS